MRFQSSGFDTYGLCARGLHLPYRKPDLDTGYDCDHQDVIGRFTIVRIELDRTRLGE